MVTTSGHLLLLEVGCAHGCVVAEVVVEVCAVLRCVMIWLCHGFVAVALVIFLVEALG